jgi:ribosomal protein S18 acetylase RimI-like enzyme
MIRGFRESDRETLKRITLEVFAESAIDYHLEKEHGLINGRDWKWRKARHIDDDIRANAAGVFVWEESGEILGYVTVTLDGEAGIGRIPNIAVSAAAQGKGIGRKLLEHALEYMKREGMSFAKIETLVGNETGEYLYPSVGFEEIARQIHFFKKL